MIDGPSPQHWANLRIRRPLSEGALATEPLLSNGNVTPVLLGMDQAGHLHLLIPIVGGCDGARPPDLNGLKVRHRYLENGQYLDLDAHPAHERVFTPVCKEVAEAVIVDTREPWAAVTAIIRAWQSAWKPLRADMDGSVQVGLFGELLVLETLMIPCLGPKAVLQWSGPDWERHDFVGGNLHIEVKTTRKSRHEHEISRLDQLSVPTGRQLLLVSVLLEASIAGDQTLATRLDAITNQIRTDSFAVDNFHTKLANLGWSEEMRRSGQLMRFFLREAFVYLVDDEFPRLPESFVLPPGVVGVKYVIDLANLASLGVDETKAIIRSANQ